MFDPTAFENMRVVIEGYLYDKDLDGELSIIDRNDIVNLSKLTREYMIEFQLKNSSSDHKATFCLKAGLENLAAELLPGNILASKQGSFVKLQFHVIHLNELDLYDKLQTGFQQIWGEKRTILQNIQYNPLNTNRSVENRITIEFNRLIVEDQMDDLLDMIDHMVETLIWLKGL